MQFTIVLLGCCVLLGVLNMTDAFSFAKSDENFCEANREVKVQMVLAMDQTGTFTSNYKSTFELVYRDLVLEVETKYPGSEFAVTTFSEYDEASLPSDEQPERADTSRTNSGPLEDCYSLIINFTQSARVITNAIHSLPGKNGHRNNGESSLTAVMFAAVDKRLGWTNGPVDLKDGRFVKKIIVLATDETATRKLDNPGQRKPPKGDGTDTCKSTLPPTDLEIEAALRSNDVSVIGLYTTIAYERVNRPNQPNIIYLLDYYTDIFGRMAITYNNYALDNSKPREIADNILLGISDAVECEEEDPPAYNTLGL